MRFAENVIIVHHRVAIFHLSDSQSLVSVETCCNGVYSVLFSISNPFSEFLESMIDFFSTFL